MTKEKIIEYWTKSSERDWKAALDLTNSGSLVQA